ncbi:TetR/AcrR family transcriptional regulator [Oceaniserpentilla sp. 4NH20-0058]|uniref:TetR/AcrR family transcriptional regulator n=1 Tax=Oceaniserpentilla sp. 4NH20-0058 TaxID=3127660 RepID=UPI00310BF1D7
MTVRQKYEVGHKLKPVNHKDQVRLNRESLILDVALTQLNEKGFQGLTMQGIANATDYSKGTIYQHFGCKEDVITKLVIQCAKRLLHLIDVALEHGQGLRHQVILVSWAFFKNAERHPVLTGLLSRAKSPDFQSKVSEPLQTELSFIDQTILSKVMGLFASQTDLAPEQVKAAAFGWWAMKWGVQDVMVNGWELSRLGFDDPKKFFFESLHIFLDGFGVQQDEPSRQYEQLQTLSNSIFKI